MRGSGGLTWCTIEVGDAEHVGRAAHGTARSTGAEWELALEERTLAWNGGGHGSAGAGDGYDDAGEVHVDLVLEGSRKFLERCIWLIRKSCL